MSSLNNFIQYLSDTSLSVVKLEDYLIWQTCSKYLNWNLFSRQARWGPLIANTCSLPTCIPSCSTETRVTIFTGYSRGVVRPLTYSLLGLNSRINISTQLKRKKNYQYIYSINKKKPWMLSCTYLFQWNIQEPRDIKCWSHCHSAPHLKMVRILLLSLLLFPVADCQEVSGQLLSLVNPKTLSANKWVE